MEKLEQELARKGQAMREYRKSFDYFGDYETRTREKAQWKTFLKMVQEHRKLVRQYHKAWEVQSGQRE